MLLVVTEVLSHGAGSVGRDVLHRCGFGSRGSNNDGVVHRSGIGKYLDHLCDRRALLPNCVVNTDEVIALVVDDCVDRNRGLACLTVTDNELALSAANRNHAIDGFQSGCHWLAHRLTINDTWSDTLQRDK